MTKRTLLGAKFAIVLTLMMAGLTENTGAGDFDISGSSAVEVRYFPSSPLFNLQEKMSFSPSLALEADITYEWNDYQSRLTFVPFARLDADDDNRSHFDIRELKYLHMADGWDAVIGIDTVFWGVTESRHLVNIINQDDAVENLDFEDKLGQTMININLERPFGTFSLFVLPGFRERSFNELNHRFSGPLKIDTDRATYEASNGNNHVDFAARWQHIFGDLEVALSHFSGTSREARLIPEIIDSVPILTPHYDQINQTALEVQYIAGATLFKLESMTRSGQGDRFAAVVAGIEHTLYGVMGSRADLGIIVEYLYDGRNPVTAPVTSLDHDIFVGFRLALNDLQDSSLLLGSIIDHTTGSTLISLEVERRIGQNWKVELETRLFIAIDDLDPLYVFKQDDSLTFRLTRFF